MPDKRSRSDFVFRPLVPQKQIKVVDTASESGGLEAALGFGDDSGNDNGNAATSEVVLNPQEAKIYKLLDGKRSVENIMEMTGLGDFDVCRTLFDFIDRNLVAPSEQGASTATRTTRARTLPRVGDAVVADEPSDHLGTGILAGVGFLCLLGLLVSFSSPFRIPGFGSLLDTEAQSIERSRDLARMERVLAALDSFYLAFGRFPAQLDDLVNANPPLLATEDLRDASGDAFHYQSSADAIQLSALGPTGEVHLSFSRRASAEAAAPDGAHSAARSSSSSR